MNLPNLKTIRVTLKGIMPLLVHNSRLANPFDPIVQELKKWTSKRRKSEEDLWEIARLEFFGGLYTDENKRPVIPGYCLVALVIEGLKKRKKGAVGRSAIFIHEDSPILYTGPKDPDKLWADPRFRDQRMETVNSGKVLRTRPCFHDWSLKFNLQYMSDVIDYHDLEEAVITAGQLIGLGDRRPSYGRFEATLEAE